MLRLWGATEGLATVELVAVEPASVVPASEEPATLKAASGSTGELVTSGPTSLTRILSSWSGF